MRELTRKELLALAAAVPLASLLTACGAREEAAGEASPPAAEPSGGVTATAMLPATPACDDGDDPTPEQTEGPYYTPDSPQRAALLEEGIAGTRLVVSGIVLGTGCSPVDGALLDFWHADDAGVYDNEGYRLRGHQFTAADGRYRLETIRPGLYTGRTRHIHVKVQAPGQGVLTTQLYFPDEPANDEDGIFDERLLMDVREADGGLAASFTFVVAAP